MTEWFMVEARPPRAIPHVVELGDWRQRAFVLRPDGSWRQVHEGKFGEVLPLDGDRAVVLASAKAIYRRDSDRPLLLDDDTCPGHRLSMAATKDGTRLVCTVARASPDGCDVLVVTQLDGRGTRLRSDTLAQSPPCRWRARGGLEPRYWVAGVTAGYDPFVLVRSQDHRRTWFAFILSPDGAREFGALDASGLSEISIVAATQLATRVPFESLVGSR